MARYTVLPATAHLSVPKDNLVVLVDRVPIAQDLCMLTILLQQIMQQVMHLLLAKTMFCFTCMESSLSSLFYLYNKSLIMLNF